MAWRRRRQESISAAQVLAGEQPENTNAFLQLLAQAGRAAMQGAAAGNPHKNSQQHVPPMQLPASKEPAQPLPAAKAGPAPFASVWGLGEAQEAQGVPAVEKLRRPESARRGPPPAGGQRSAPDQARVRMQALPPLLLAAQGLGGGFPREVAGGTWQGQGAAQRHYGTAARSEGAAHGAGAADEARQDLDDLAEASALVRAVGQARRGPARVVAGLAMALACGMGQPCSSPLLALLVLHAALACSVGGVCSGPCCDFADCM